MNSTTDNSNPSASISFETANGDTIVGLHAAKEYIKRMEILKHGKSTSAQNQIEQEIQNCAEKFNISQETIDELKYFSDETGIDTEESDDTNDYYIDDTDSDFEFSSDTSSSDDNTNDFDFDFSLSSLFGNGDNGDIDSGLFNNRPMLRGYRPMRRYRIVGRRPLIDGESDTFQQQQPQQPSMYQQPFDPLAPHVVYSMLMVFLILGICACIWAMLCGFGIGCLIKKKELRFKDQIKRDIENASKNKDIISVATYPKDGN